jgi:hypothetical protein
VMAAKGKMGGAKKSSAAKKKAVKTVRVKNPFGGTMQKGGLHKSLGVPLGQKIPAAKLAAAKAGKYGARAKKQAQFAGSLAKIRP